MEACINSKLAAWPRDPRYMATPEGMIIGPFGRPLKPRAHMHGYLRMSAIMDGRARDFYIHRVVCEAFHGFPPDPAMQVDHINGDRADNRPENLRWVSKAENLAHRHHPVGSDRCNTRLTDDEVRGIRAANGSQSMIAKQFGVSREHVRDIRNGKGRPYVDD